jgi:hypothetical protein
MAPHTAQIRVDEQAADQRGVVVVQAGPLKTGSGEFEQWRLLHAYKT